MNLYTLTVIWRRRSLKAAQRRRTAKRKRAMRRLRLGVRRFFAAFSFAISQTLLIWILGPHRKRDPAARRKLRRHNRFTRRARFYEIVQNPIGDRFVKRALVPIGREVELERFAFDAKPVWHVIDVDPGKIG